MTDSTSAPNIASDDVAAIQKLQEAHKTIRREMGKVIVGQERVLDELLMCIFARGHAILEGVPGLAKTLAVSTLAKSLSLDFHRIQFTPDLMPSDITGTEVIHEDRASGTREFRFIPGPLFANVILADEINRTPPKTQAALLEAMQERQVTAGGKRYPMKDPFFVLATQNPIEQEGTYPLPEAQQDRFMFKILVTYPKWDEEFEIVKVTTSSEPATPTPVLSGEDIIHLQRIIRRVPVADHLVAYTLKLVRQTRVMEGDVPSFVKEYVSWGAGPRACQYLVLGAKTHAVLNGRHHVSVQDIQAVAKPVLRHRILTNFTATSEGVTPDVIVDRLIAETPAHEGAISKDGTLAQTVKS
jgi:MoxR-like ATPase